MRPIEGMDGGVCGYHHVFLDDDSSSTGCSQTHESARLSPSHRTTHMASHGRYFLVPAKRGKWKFVWGMVSRDLETQLFRVL